MDYQRAWRASDRRKASYRQRMRPVFLHALDSQIEPVLERIMQSSNIEQVQIPALDDSLIDKAYKKLYLATSVDFARSRRIQVRKLIARKADDDEMFDDLIQRKVIEYLRLHSGNKITAVGDTSKELIQQLLRKLTPEIIAEGLSASRAQTMLRDLIESEWHRAAYYRTERIVRTEVNTAANWGSLEGAKSLGVEMTKTWLSAFAKDSRQSHMDANGQTVPLDEPFIVWDEPLDYPGDPNGRAENVINCLCTTYESLK